MTVRAEDIETIVALLRVSTEAQEREGYSLQAQEQARDRDCRTFAWRCLATYEGHETGSALSQRRIIHELITFIRENRPDAVWVIEQSRLTRGDELDVAMLLRELRESGTKVVTERGHVVDPDDLEGAFHFRLKALMDRREWEVIAARNKRGKDEKAKLGLSVNGRPAFGYCIGGEGRQKGRRVIVPEEAAVVRSIFEMTAEGLSSRRIIQRLHEQGIPAPTQAGRISGKKPERFRDGVQLWGRTTLRRILNNPLYLGVSFRSCWIKRGRHFVFETDKRKNPHAIWIPDAHEAIVTQDLWDAAHSQIAGLTNRKHHQLHMLTGLLVCPLCGNTFNVTTSRDGRGHEHNYYFCRSKRQVKNEYGAYVRTSEACPSKWLPLEQTDRLIWDAFVRLVTSPESIEQYLASAEAEKRRSRLQDEIAQLQESLANVEAMLARAREKLLSEILTDGEYLRERERLDTQLRGIQKRLLTKRAEFKAASKEAARQVVQNLALLKLGEKKLSRDQRSRLFHALVKRVIPKDVSLRRIEIELYVTPPARDGEPVTASTRAQQDCEPVVVAMALPLVPNAG